MEPTTASADEVVIKMWVNDTATRWVCRGCESQSASFGPAGVDEARADALRHVGRTGHPVKVEIISSFEIAPS